MTRRSVVLDVDGTLVDSVYVHVHTWAVAFREVGLEVPSHHIHAAIGMGGDRLVTHVAGKAAERAVGDRVRSLHRAAFVDSLDAVRPTPGAAELVEAIRERGAAPVVASSADREMTGMLLEIAGVADLVEAARTGDQTQSSKPHPESVQAVLEQVGAQGVLMIGDAPWDAQAAEAAGVTMAAVLTGGFAASTLREAGARSVHESPAALLLHLDALGV